MSVVIVTGAAGLIGSEAAEFFHRQGLEIVGIDNDMRRYFFGEEASTRWKVRYLQQNLQNYTHFDVDIRDEAEIGKIFQMYGNNIVAVIHAAAQPSHDWAAKAPEVDFTINANGTLNLLEKTRTYAKDAVFIYCSTNKVYGDTPNRLPLREQPTRWEIETDHPFYEGITESMSIDQSTHSLFGVSKAAADLLVQEYGRYFGMKTGVFRGGCLTGPSHSGTQLHGFLAYLMKCTVSGTPYTVFGYKGKQVRDNIHSYDLVNAFYHFFRHPRIGEVYNIGGGRHSNCSMLEAIEKCEQISGRKLNWVYSEQNRIGDHIWWISGIQKFAEHYPEWQLTYDIDAILQEIYQHNHKRWSVEK